MADPNDQWAAFNPQPAPSMGAPSSIPGRPIITGPAPQPKTTYRPLTPEEITSGKFGKLNPNHTYQLSSEGQLSDLGDNSSQAGTGEQQTAGGFYARALFANQKYGNGVPPRDSFTQGIVNVLPESVVNSFTGDARQQADTFARDFVAATLRKESGAAISPEEYANQYKRYFPMPGDSQQTIADKAQLRQTAILALKNMAGPAAPTAEQQVQKMLGQPSQQPNQPLDPSGQGDIGFNTPRTPTNPFNDQQSAAFDAWIKANPNATPEQLKAFVQSIGVGNVTNADEVVKALQQTGRIQPASAAVFDKPDITDVRGGKNTGTQDAINAAARGVGDVVTMGGLDKAIALGDTVTKGGTFDQNLNRQYAISDFDQQNHPFARFGGQALGGALLPMGEVNSLGNLALKGAGYGAAYGAGSSRSLGDVPMNALLGGVAGAAVPLVFGGAGKAVNALRSARPTEIPPLVDPVTGELNQVMDAMTPAQRVQMMRDQGFDTITPGMAGGRTARVIEQGFNNIPGSAGVMEDANAAISNQARRAMQNTAQQFGSSKTLSEGGAALQSAAVARNDRAATVIGKAYNAIPISEAAQASKANTLATLGDLTGRFQSNPQLADAMKDPALNRYLDAFQSGNISWKDLKDFRSIIGEKIGQMRFGESSSTSDLRALYAALSQDMRDTAAAQGPKALRAFERANTLNRQNEELIQGALTRILGPDGNMTPEKAAAAVQAMTRGGKSTGDIRTLAQIKGATVKSGAWDEIASTLIHLGGQPANSEGRAFNPQTFVQWYSDMSEPARRMLFKPELRKSLDNFVATSQQLARVKGLTNTSNTTPTMIGSGVVAAGGVAAFTQPLALIPLIGGGIANNVMAKIWTSPKFIDLMTGYSKAAASGNANAVKSQIGRLQKLAATNPELREGIEAIVRSFANDNAPQLGSAVASPDQRPDQQQ